MISIVKELLFSEEFKAKHRTSPNFFIRDRILNFPLLVLYLANFIKGSSQDELDQLFKAIHKLDVPERMVTPSALSQARRKLSHEVFIDLQDAVCAFVNDNAPLVTYHGMRVFAIDGSTMVLPDTTENREHFGTASNKDSQRAMARISIFHDILNRITIDGLIRPYNVGETTMTWDHLEDARLPAGSLIVMDRGYNDFRILKTLFLDGHQFCVRVRSDLRIYKEFLRSGLDEMILDYEPSEDLCSVEGRKSRLSKSFRVRMVRIRVDGQEYVLMTSLLDSKVFPIYEIADLYHQRWEVEESYKVKKCRMKLETLSGSTPEIIRQDFHAKVFAECLTAALMLETREEVETYSLTTRNEYKISLTQALAKMKNVLVLLFIRRPVKKLIASLHNIFFKSLTAALPGRKFPRRGTGKGGLKKQTYSMGYK